MAFKIKSRYVASGAGGPGGGRAGGARQKQKQGISISMVGEALQWQVSVGIDEGRGRSAKGTMSDIVRECAVTIVR